MINNTKLEDLATFFKSEIIFMIRTILTKEVTEMFGERCEPPQEGGLCRNNGAVGVALFEDAGGLHGPTGCLVGSPGGDHLGG